MHATGHRRFAIVDYIAAQVNFPEIDLRQRLTVSRGYGVAEIFIPEGSEYVGKSINESGLREKDIIALTLYRGTTVYSKSPLAAGNLKPVIGCFASAGWN